MILLGKRISSYSRRGSRKKPDKSRRRFFRRKFLEMHSSKKWSIREEKRRENTLSPKFNS